MASAMELLTQHADVFKEEEGAIETRRDKSWSSKEANGNGHAHDNGEFKWKPQKPGDDDFVGLALSGGGIRAASLGLGVLQTLCRNGLIRSVDYLSTVSGGGYIGSHFSSLVVRRNKAAEKAKSGPVSLEHILDVDTAMVTDRPHLARAAVNFQPLMPDLEVAEREQSTPVALERILDDETKPAPDQQPIDRASTNAQPKKAGLSTGVRKLIFGGKYLYRPWEATNKYLIGLVLTNLSIFAGVVAFAALVALAWRSLDLPLVRNYLDPFLLGSDVTAAFLPAFGFFFIWLLCWALSLIQGEAPGKWTQGSFYLMLASLMIGVVLLAVNGKETKVGWIGALLGVGGATASTGLLSKLLSALLAAGLLPFLRPTKLIAMGLSQRTFRERVVFRIASFAFLVGVPLFFIGLLGARNISRTASDPENNIRPGDVRNWPAFASLLCGEYTPHLPVLDESKGATAPEKSNEPATTNTVPADLRAHVHSLLDQRLLRSTKWQLFESSPWYLRLWYRSSWLAPFANPLSDSWVADRAADREAVRVCEIINEHILPSRSLPNSLANKKTLDTAIGNSAKLPELTTLKKLGLPNDDDTREVLNDAYQSYGTLWRTDDAKIFNQWLLRTTHPECFYTDGGAYRWIVTEGDEIWRMWALGFASVVFCIGLRVNMNRASMHRFYRNRLKHAYVVSPDKKTGDIKLSELNTTDYGAPYHLLNTTLELTHPTGLDEADKECDDETLADRRDRQIFIFSQKYCGASATGWRETKAYEDCMAENISLADAMALSGAASDAMLTNSLPLTLMITALNLTLGQWVPNPALPKPPTKPRVHRLLRDWRKPVKDSIYAFVCDGGFTDNLGVLSLVKRRCKVIISLDAGCDANHEFSDLGLMLRMARIQDGIRIMTPSKSKADQSGSGNSGMPVDPRSLEMRTFETSLLEPNQEGISKSHFAIGRIDYPASAQRKAETGWLIYIKPSFTGDEGSDLVGYRRRECEFPHHTTADQFYDATRFESYRELGVHMCTDVCNQIVASVGDSLEQKLASLYDELSAKPGDAPSLEMSAFQVSEAFVATNKALGEIARSTPRREALFARRYDASSAPIVDGQDGNHQLSEQIEMYLQELSSEICRVQATGQRSAAEKLANWHAFINQCSLELSEERSTLSPKLRAVLQRKMSELIGTYELLSSRSFADGTAAVAHRLP